MRGIRRDIIARGTQGLLKYLKSRIDDEELSRLREKGQVSPVPSLCGSPTVVPDKYAMKTASVMNLAGKELTYSSYYSCLGSRQHCSNLACLGSRQQGSQTGNATSTPG